MQITKTEYPLADYCLAMQRDEILVNRQYQRSDKVWPPAARSFLIETILLGYPIPKLYLYQKTDIKSKKVYKEIVDGQQRSETILAFYENRLPLSKKFEELELAGKTYDEIDDEYKQRFLDYAISVDVLLSATTDEIREVFRRINSYTVPLNPEEQRHAEFQGTFKWFVYALSKKYERNFLDFGVFGEKQLIRMYDAKLFSELAHAFIYGVTTTKSEALYKLYKEKDDEFAEQPEIERRLDAAIGMILAMPEIHNGPLMKPHMFYSLILAISHCQEPHPRLAGIFTPAQPFVLNRDIAITNLTALSEALEEPEEADGFAEFVSASTSKTNVAEQRIRRVKWFCRALQAQLL